MISRFKYSFFKFGFFTLLVLSVYLLNNKETKCNSNHNLTNLIIPFHVKQLYLVEENIRNWEKYAPCENHYNNFKPSLIFFVGYSENDSIKNIENSLKNLKTFFKCFSNFGIVKYELEKHDDNHVKGARLMFEYLIGRKHVLFSRVKYVFYMEPDTRPIRSNWLDAIQNEIGFSKFWMKGSFYLGAFEFRVNKYFPNKYHINGNAIYNIGDEEFSKFYFNNLRPYIMRHGDSITAYDTDFSEYIFDVDNYRTVQKIIHNFAFTQVILDLWRQNYSVAKIRKQFRNSYLVHGGFPED